MPAKHDDPATDDKLPEVAEDRSADTNALKTQDGTTTDAEGLQEQGEHDSGGGDKGDRTDAVREWGFGKWATALSVSLLSSFAMAAALILWFGAAGGSVTAAIRVWGVVAAVLNVVAGWFRLSAHYPRKGWDWSWKDIDGLGKTLSLLSALYVIVGLVAVH